MGNQERFMSSQVNQTKNANADLKPYILNHEEGEELQLGPRKASLLLKATPKTGSHNMTAIMERIPPGDGIPVHKHTNEDELIFVHSGKAVVTLGDEEFLADSGSIVFVPEGVWHGPRNPSSDKDLLMLAIFSSTGIEKYFRGFSVNQGEEWVKWDKEKELEFEQRHGVVYKDQI
jgi:quercetin dioxygenase-like cupin family protein